MAEDAFKSDSLDSLVESLNEDLADAIKARSSEVVLAKMQGLECLRGLVSVLGASRRPGKLPFEWMAQLRWNVTLSKEPG